MNVKFNITIFLENLVTEGIVEFSKNIVKKDIELNKNEKTFLDSRIITEYFTRDINKYRKENNLNEEDILLDGYEITSKTKNVNVFFESSSDYLVDEQPSIFAVMSDVETTQLCCKQIGSKTVKWYWEEDNMAHYIVDENDSIVAHIPLNINEYIESNLEEGITYRRFLVSYNEKIENKKSNECNITIKEIDDNLVLDRVFTLCKRNEKLPEYEGQIDEKLKAFRCGVGDFNDCKIYKAQDLSYNKRFKLKNKIYGVKGSEQVKHNTIKFLYRYKMQGKIDEMTYDNYYEIEATAYEICDREDEPSDFVGANIPSSGVGKYTMTKESFVHEIYLKSLFPTLVNNYTKRYKFNITVKSITGSLRIYTHPYGQKTFLEANNESVTFTLKGYYDTVFRVMGLPVIREVDYIEIYPPLENQPLVGAINGDFESTPDGKKDYIQTVPFIDHPKELRDRKIYCNILNVEPKEAYVKHSFASDSNDDGYTLIQNDKITFYSDSIIPDGTEYYEFIGQIDKGEYYINDYKKHTLSYNLSANVNINKYKRFELRVEPSTDDIMVLEYQKPLIPDDKGNISVDLNVDVRALQSALAKWSPFIHNGYYYYNQKEHYLYNSTNQSGVNKILENVFHKSPVSINVGVDVREPWSEPKKYNITLNTKKDLLINDFLFEYDNGFIFPKAITIDGEFYEFENEYIYYSKPLVFDKKITSYESITWDENSNEDNKVEFYVQVYNDVNGEWTSPIRINKGEPLPNILKSNMVKFCVKLFPANKPPIQTYRYTFFCENDYDRYCNKYFLNNIYYDEEVVVPKSPKTEAIYVSKVFDLGTTREEVKKRAILINCVYEGDIQIYYQDSDDYKDINEKLIQDRWMPLTNNKRQHNLKRFVKYKIIIGPNSKLFHMELQLDRYAYRDMPKKDYLPGVGNIVFKGSFNPNDSYKTISNTISYELVFDARRYMLIGRLKEYVQTILRPFDYSVDDVVGVRIEPFGFLNNEFYINYDKDVENGISTNPVYIASYNVLEDEQLASENYDGVKFIVDNRNIAEINPIPQQYAPIILFESNPELTGEKIILDPRYSKENSKTINVEDIEINDYKEPYRQVFFEDDDYNYVLENKEEFISNGFATYYLQYSDIDIESVSVTVNDVKHTNFTIYENIIDLKECIKEGDVVVVKYKLLKSFCVNYDYENDKAIFNIHKNSKDFNSRVYKVFYETNKHSSLRKLQHISLNPIYNTLYSGYIYICEDTFSPANVRINSFTDVIYANGLDETTVLIQVTDKYDNPVQDVKVSGSAKLGSLSLESDVTDYNGIVKATYTSYTATAVDTITASVGYLKDTCNIKNIKIKDEVKDKKDKEKDKE